MSFFRSSLFCLIAILFFSCSGIKVSEDELKAVNKVLELVGGRCAYGFKYETTSKGKSTYFTLAISESNDLELLSDIPELPASGSAYTFYSNLANPKKYTHIQVTLSFKNGDKKIYVYSIDELESVKRQMNRAYNVASLLKERKFDSLSKILNDSSYIEYDKISLLKSVKAYEEKFGDLREFVPFGYRFQEVGNGSVNLHISGLTFRNKDFVRFSVDLDTTDKSNRVIVFNYKY